MRALLIIGLFFAISCSSKKSPKPIAPDRLRFDDRETAKLALTNDRIRCEGDCAESVAAFYLYDEKSKGSATYHEIKLCSATLIAHNRILTNKHCIDGVLKAGDACSDKIFAEIKFPQTKGKPFASYKCKKVVSSSADYIFKDGPDKNKKKQQVPDWAVIELTESVKDRTPVVIDGDPVEQDPLPVTLYPVYFNLSDSPPTGVLRQVNCQRVYNKGGLHIYSNDSDSPLFRIEKCSHALIQGNSGTGVFYENSARLLGVMATTDSISAGGTMAHCLPDFNNAPSKCIFPDEQEFTDAMKTVSFATKLHQQMLERYGGDPVWKTTSGLEYFDDADAGRYRNVKYSLNDFWKDSADYLELKGSAKLAERYGEAFLKLILLRVPRCYGEALTAKKDLYLMELDSWKKIDDYHWSETIKTDGNGNEISYLEAKSMGVVTQLRPVRFETVADGSQILMRAVGSELPKPLKTLEIRISACH